MLKMSRSASASVAYHYEPAASLPIPSPRHLRSSRYFVFATAQLAAYLRVSIVYIAR